ncbi:TPA: hypothetical protein ACH3X1_012479 [Trebouxia sp. C0004]
MKHPMEDDTPADTQYGMLGPAQIAPCGCSIQPEQQSAALQSCQQLVETLAPVHAASFVHHDIRLDNIVKGPDGWVLIDWELAGREESDCVVDGAGSAACHQGWG